MQRPDSALYNADLAPIPKSRRDFGLDKVKRQPCGASKEMQQSGLAVCNRNGVDMLAPRHGLSLDNLKRQARGGAWK
jgi:hypothetical protein